MSEDKSDYIPPDTAAAWSTCWLGDKWQRVICGTGDMDVQPTELGQELTRTSACTTPLSAVMGHAIAQCRGGCGLPTGLAGYLCDGCLFRGPGWELIKATSQASADDACKALGLVESLREADTRRLAALISELSEVQRRIARRDEQASALRAHMDVVK